jgi:hypothetical protein
MMQQRIVRGGLAAGFLVSMFGCGPAAIGAGLAGMGGGGGTRQLVPPSVTAAAVAFQPFDEATVLGLRLAQPDARNVRLRFEYDIGQGRVRIPASSLELWDAASRTARPLSEVDTGGNAVLASARGGEDRLFLWQHARDLGQIEPRDVAVFAVFADALTADAGFTAESANSVALFAPRTLGRELAELTEAAVRRESSDAESSILIDGVLRDRGDDLAITEFEFAFATSAGAGATDYVALATAAPIRADRSIDGDGRVRYDLTWRFDPFTAGIPVGAYDSFWLRLQHREAYPQVRSDLPPSRKEGVPIILPFGSQQIGQPPRIEAIAVVDPGSPATSIGELGRPWLRLPVTLTMFNPSSRVTQRIRLSGRYRIGGESPTFLPITPWFTGEPQSDDEFELEPLERKNQYLVWNVIRDEGLGNLPVNSDPLNPPRVAEIGARALLVGARVGSSFVALGGNPLASDAPNSVFSTLSTPPFVDFRENLLPQAMRVWSAGDDLTQRTRDLFFTLEGASNQETRIRLDQQFEARQIVPPPPEYDFNPPFTNGIYEIVPTDFDPTQPDCLIWGSDRFFTAVWPANGASPTVTELFPHGPVLQSRGIDPQVFQLGAGQNRWQVVVFHTWSEQPLGTGKQLRLQLTTVVRDPQGQWSLQTGPVEVRDIEGAGDLRPYPVHGEFDGDGASHEVVIGTLGGEYATPTAPGLLDLWRFRLVNSGGNTVVQVEAPVPLAKPPLPATEPSRTISEWILTKWRDDAASGDALCLVRQFAPSGPRPQEVVVHLLRQPSTGILQSSWQLENGDLGVGNLPIGGRDLDRVFALDLDGSDDGNPGSDLLLVFRRRLAPSQNNVADIWHYSRNTSGPRRWRRLVEGLRPQDPLTGQLADGQFLIADFELVDVNGDRRLDLVTGERFLDGLQQPLEPFHYNYLASALSGVAGRLDGLGPSAGSPTFRSSLPGLIDANGDGRVDVISGGRLHFANFDGSYTQGPGGFGGGTNSRYRVERMRLDGGNDSMEVVVSDPDDAAQNRIVRLSGLGAGQAPFAQMLETVDFGGAVRELRAIANADAFARQRKDLAAIVGLGAGNELRLLRSDGAGTVLATLGVAIDDTVGLALVRRGELVAGRSPAMDPTPQDIVVAANPGGSGRVLRVFEGNNGFQPRDLPLPAGQVPVRIAEGSASTDAREDLLVLTRTPLAWHVVAFLQSTDAATGLVSAPVELLRFQSPFPNATPRSFAFSQTRERLCEGFVLFGDATPGSQRSEVRLIDLLDEPAGLAARLVRSPLAQPVDHDVRVVVRDDDQDGVLEVIGGEVATPNGLRRMRANSRNP